MWFSVCHVRMYMICQGLLSNAICGSKILMPLAIISHLRDLWQVCYNKLNQEGNYRKTDVWDKSQDICQKASFFLAIDWLCNYIIAFCKYDACASW